MRSIFLKTKYRYANKYSYIYEEIVELREMCVKNTLSGHLDRIDYTIYGANSFLDEPWVDTERWLELKRIYNEVLVECEPMMKSKK